MVSVAWLTPTGMGPFPAVMVGGAWPQPEVFFALQVAVLMTDTVLSPELATYSVCVTWLIASPAGPLPTVMVAGVWPQPAVTRALQVAPLMTETVSVAWSTVTPDNGALPTVMVGQVRLQPDGRAGLQAAALITETVLSLELAT